MIPTVTLNLKAINYLKVSPIIIVSVLDVNWQSGITLFFDHFFLGSLTGVKLNFKLTVFSFVFIWVPQQQHIL